MRDILHRGGLALATISAGVAIVTANTPLAHIVAPGCAVAIVIGAVLCAATHKPGEHGPRREG